MTGENRAKKFPQYLAAALICICAVATGTTIGWSANITGDLENGGLNGFKMNKHEIGWAGSSMTLGAMVICFPIGFIADAIGRKLAVLLMTFPFVIGWLMMIFAQHIYMVYTGRFLTGIGGGSIFITAPLYINEIAETDIRGTLGTFVQLFVTIGILISQILGYAVPLLVFHFILLAIPIAFAILFMFQPETPVYLVRQGKMDDGLKAFKRMRGKEYDPSEEIKVIEDQMAKEAETPGCWEGMKLKSSKKAMVICLTLMFYFQLSGVNAIIFYTNEIFTASGSSLPAHWCVIIIGVVQVLATLFSSWSIDKLGRKILLIASSALMAGSCALLGLFFTLKNKEIIDKYAVQDIGFLPVLSLITFIIGFSIGFGPVTWVICFEIFSPAIKAKCSSIGVTVSWFLAFITTRFYLNVANAIGDDATFYIFAAITASAIFFVLLMVPETKGKTFAEIQNALEGKS